MSVKLLPACLQDAGYTGYDLAPDTPRPSAAVFWPVTEHLRKYPPDRRNAAVELVLQQALALGMALMA